MDEIYFIKVFPECGPAFIVGVPGQIADVDAFLEDQIQNIQFWEPLEV